MTTTALAPSSGTQLAWCQPQTANEAWVLAETIAKSRLAPKGYDTVEQIFIAMQHGAELGLNAMQALQGIAMVNGRPAVWGTTLWALVQRSRLVHRWMKGTLALPAVDKIITGVWKGKTDANAALIDALVVRLADRADELKSRKVVPPPEHLCGYAVFQLEDDIHVQLFDSAHAQKAGLLGKSGPWSQYPERMHLHRAVTFLARDACGSALTGIAGQPTAEEMLDMGAVDTTATDVPQAGPSTTARIIDMSATTAGAPPSAPPVERDADAKAVAAARLKAAIDRLLTIPWGEDGETMTTADRTVLVNRTIVEVFGTIRPVGQMSPEDRLTLATALDRIEAQQAVAEPELEADGPEDKTNF